MAARRMPRCTACGLPCARYRNGTTCMPCFVPEPPESYRPAEPMAKRIACLKRHGWDEARIASFLGVSIRRVDAVPAPAAVLKVARRASA